MLTLLLRLVEAPESASGIRETLLVPPSIFTSVDLLLTLGIIFVLWRHRRRFLPAEDMTPRQYERLSGRLDFFERTLNEDRTHRDARLDEIEEKLVHRAAEDFEFRRAVLEAEDSQLRTMRSVEAGVEALRRKMDYFNTTLEKVPCIRENGSIKNCTEGQG